MWTFYRLIDPNGQNVIDCNSIDFVKGMIRALPPGRYTIEQISTSDLPTWCSTDRWGVIVNLGDGRIIEQPYAKESLVCSHAPLLRPHQPSWLGQVWVSPVPSEFSKRP